MALRKREQAASLRLDAGRLYAVLDAKRRHLGMTLEDTASELRVSASTMACWRRGGGMQGDVALRIALLCDIDLRDYAVRVPPADPLPQAREAA
jgi:transcriptional regulator with XRE-family HTH domain